MLNSQQNIDSERNLLTTQEKIKKQNVHKNMKIRSIKLKSPVQGFQNEAWKYYSFKILLLVLKFIRIITGTIYSQNFKNMNKKMFKIIGDKASNFQVYLMNNYFENYKPERITLIKYNLENQYLHKMEQYQWWRYITSNKFTLNPNWNIIQIWNIYQLLIINLALFYTTAKFAFQIENRPSQFQQYKDIIFYQIPCYSFAFDIVIKFHLQYYEKGQLIDERMKIVVNYFKSGNTYIYKIGFILDIMVILSQILNLYFNIVNLDILIIVKIWQIPTITHQLLDRIELTGRYIAIYDLIRLFYLIILEAHFCSCGWFYVGMSANEGSWIDNFQLMEKDWLEQYVHSFYWSIITMSTIGYGDYTPQNLREKTYVIFIALFSCCTFGYSLGCIGQIFGQLAAKSNKIRLEMNSLKKYLRVKGYSNDLQTKIRKYYEYIWNGSEQDDIFDFQKIQNTLPTYLQQVNKYSIQEMIVDLNLKSLKKISFLSQNFDEIFLSQLAGKFTEEKYGPESQIFSKNTQCDQFYILQEGEVEYYQEIQGNYLTIQKFNNRDDPFAQIEFFSDSIHQISCRSTVQTRVIKITKKDFQEIAKDFGYESYCELKDKLKFSGRSDVLATMCQGCNKSSHQTQNCPMITGFPNKFKFLLEYKRNSYQNRKWIKRTNYGRRLNSLKFENDIVDSVIGYLLNDQLNLKQIESEFEVEKTKNSRLKRLRPIQLKRASMIGLKSGKKNKPKFLHDLYQMRLKIESEKSILNPMQDITETEEGKLAQEISKSVIIKRIVEARSSSKLLESETELNNLEVSSPCRQIFQQPQMIHDQINWMPMGNYKDIYDNFDRICDYEKYMSHMNFKSQVDEQDQQIERKKFQKFIQSNMNNKKRKTYNVHH